MTDTIVSKFGGSSITCAKDIQRIREIVQADSRRKVVVVSAPGKRSPEDVKVTDLLIEFAVGKEPSVATQIYERFRELGAGNVKGLEAILMQRVTNCNNDAELASIKAFGEEACARVVAERMGARYVNPKELLVVNGRFDNAKILPPSEAMIKNTLSKEGTFIIPGFFGYTEDGQIATFSRGGSDLTGAYIAAALEAVMYENFTDTDGILAADPAIVNNPELITEITFREIRDLAYSGFRVFHKDAMHPVSIRRVPVHVRNTFRFPEEGTYIVHDRISNPERPLVGIAYKGGFCTFDIERFGFNEEVGLAEKLLGAFAEEGISVEYTPSAIDDMSVVVNQSQLNGKHMMGRIFNKLYAIMGADAEIRLQENLGCLVVAGKGLKGRRGIAADIQGTLADAGVNIRFISQGPKERCIIYGIDESDGERAVEAVYDTFFR